MEDEETPQEAAPKKRSKLPLIIGVVLMLGLGGGGFFATFSGMILAKKADPHAAEAKAKTDKKKPSEQEMIAFVPIEALVVSLPPGSRSSHMRFAAQLEVEKGKETEVAALMPRVLDVLNGYLRAVAPEDLEDPAALVRLRAQMLRRVQVVTGPGQVRDLLVTEFVLN